MSTAPLLDRARDAWVTLAGVPVTFRREGEVRVSPESRLCPPQWTGIVTLGGASIATVPDHRFSAALRVALASLPAGAESTVDRWRAALPVVDVLGPACLGYLDESDFRPLAGGPAAEQLPAGHADVAALLAAAEDHEAAESGIAGITSAAFVVRDGRTAAAVAGYRHWPGEVAHLCVLTAPAHRGRGLARAAASAATSDALASRLLPQWRARVPASRRIARAIGFSELGAQLSLRVAS